MSDSLVRNGIGGLATRMLPWTPFWDWAFEYDVRRTEAGYEVEVPVPGYKPQDIDVTLQDGVIAVSGKAERRKFSRSFTVPEDVDPDAIEARVNDGLLVLTLARRPEAQPKRIAVK